MCALWQGDGAQVRVAWRNFQGWRLRRGAVKRMTPKDFKRLLARDRHCLHCGLDDDTLIPQHRINRQMGGAGTASKRNKPSNLIVLCSAFNGLIESDADAAQEAGARGWKLQSWQDPLFEPVWDSVHSMWLSLDDEFGSVALLDWDKDLG